MEIIVASQAHVKYAETVCELIYESALQRGTGIAKRTPEYIAGKMTQGKAVIALDEGLLAGFSYIETWQHQRFVANSGLVVAPKYRQTGLARQIKRKIFDLSRELYPDAKIFSITTGLAVMKLNSELGYVPVPFSELTDDEEFWKGCEGCCNYEILKGKDRRMCLCTGMLYDPAKHKKNGQDIQSAKNLLVAKYGLHLKADGYWYIEKENSHDQKVFKDSFFQENDLIMLIFRIYKLCFAKVKYFNENLAKYEPYKYHYKHGFVKTDLWDVEFFKHIPSGYFIDLRQLQTITRIADFSKLIAELDSFEIVKA